MHISVVICTYNRAASLRRTLETFCSISAPPGIQWELLLMDNNSKDDTREICRQFESKLPLRYIFVLEQGKSNALNRSTLEAKSDLILYTDDDIDVDPNWMAAYWRAAQKNPEANFFG